MSDEELLAADNDLSKYLLSVGYLEFETFMPKGSTRMCVGSAKKGGQSPSTLKKGLSLHSETEEFTYISSYDYSKLSSLLKSKLLLPDDYELIENISSRTAICNNKTSSFLLYSVTIISATMSFALYLNKRNTFYLPAALTSVFSFYCMRNCFNSVSEIANNKSFDMAIASLQNLCLNIHKVLRFLKETEILSTGQVSKHNVGAALYVPVKNLKELQTFPTWKTLPHLRKGLAIALLEVIDILKSKCNEAGKIAPDWLCIQGYTLSNQNSLSELNSLENLKNEACISLKDLQLLNDTYVILQSEFLRWIGFCICPSVWNGSNNSPNSICNAKFKILKLLNDTYLKFSNISLQLKLLFNIQNIFMETKQNLNEMPLECNLTEITSVQFKLHNVFLSILSMLIYLRNLEDQLENTSNCGSITIEGVFENKLDQQLKTVRSDLLYMVKNFDDIYFQAFSTKKSPVLKTENPENEQFDEETDSNPLLRDPLGRSINTSDCHANSIDEVFVAVTNFNSAEQENCMRDGWNIESKPQIPKTLMSELSTALRPIKENFKEREKAALERAGLVDIDNDSSCDKLNEVTDKMCLTGNTSAKSTRNKISKRNKFTRKVKLNLNNDMKSDTAISRPTESTVKNFPNASGKKFAQNESTSENNTKMGVCVTNQSVAKLIAIKSQSWGLTEDHYSDD